MAAALEAGTDRWDAWLAVQIEVLATLAFRHEPAAEGGDQLGLVVRDVRVVGGYGVQVDELYLAARGDRLLGFGVFADEGTAQLLISSASLMGGL